MPNTLDVFHWKMSAALHSSSINHLRRAIIEAHASQSPLPIRLITQLLPLQSDQLGDADARGDILFSGDNWSNEADDELWIEFEDPVLQTFNATIPRVWSGKVEVDAATGRLSIQFESKVELEIPRLSDLGVGRSSFQQLVSLDVDKEISLTILRDTQQEDRDTWIEAKLDENTLRTFGIPKEVSNYSSFDTENACGDPNDPNWYVYRRRRDGLCMVHHGEIIVGGDVAYDRAFGPGTKQQADDYERNHCGFD